MEFILWFHGMTGGKRSDCGQLIDLDSSRWEWRLLLSSHGLFSKSPNVCLYHLLSTKSLSPHRHTRLPCSLSVSGPKSRLDSVVAHYMEGEYDFGLDCNSIMGLTSYELDDAKELVAVHSRNDTGV